MNNFFFIFDKLKNKRTFRETFIIDYRASVTRVNKEFDKVRDYK
jgi:hypothetical protein